MDGVALEVNIGPTQVQQLEQRALQLASTNGYMRGQLDALAESDGCSPSSLDRKQAIWLSSDSWRLLREGLSVTPCVSRRHANAARQAVPVYSAGTISRIASWVTSISR